MKYGVLVASLLVAGSLFAAAPTPPPGFAIDGVPLPDPPSQPPPPSGDETVGQWQQATFGLPFRINMQSGSYPLWIAGGARHENLAGAWDGGRVARIYPPTSEQTYGGIGSLNVPASRSLSLRWEMRTGPTYASGGQGFVDNKHVIIHSQNGNRPMLNIQSASGGCLQAAIAQGTTKQFNQQTGYGPRISFRGEGGDLFRWCDTVSRAGDVGPGDWITISMHMSCDTTLHSSGHIRAAVWARGGARLADWWIPWNFDTPAQCTNLTGVEGIGDYYNGSGNGAAGTYFEVTGITVAVNQGLLGPRAGF
jgi:hypothetical protein